MSPLAPGVTAPSMSAMRNLTKSGGGGAGGDAGGTASAPPPASAVAGGVRRLGLNVESLGRFAGGRPTLFRLRGTPAAGAGARRGPGPRHDVEGRTAPGAVRRLPPQPVPEGRDLGEEALRLRAGAAAIAGLGLELLQQL